MAIDSGGSILSSIQRASTGIINAAERIGSGQRINSANDDAAGQAISEGLRSQISGFTQATRNANDGISLLQTADSSFSSISDGVQRLRELALQSSNGTLNDQDRSLIDDEAQLIKDEISQTVSNSSFNGRPLLSSDSPLSLQIGPNEGDNLQLEVNDFQKSLDDLDFSSIDLSSAGGASSALNLLDDVQSSIDSGRAQVGAGVNRLGSTVENLATSELAAQSSMSRISDADIAKEVSELTASQIQRDVAIALQAQANSNQKSVLQLLDGI
ncbi:MAG: flagellin [Alteromonadaceae bacterium]|nr:MAG: flagellin [Alteromonadaceae bacterium]